MRAWVRACMNACNSDYLHADTVVKHTPAGGDLRGPHTASLLVSIVE